MSQYIFQRTGGPLVYWGPGAPPKQTRAADARSLGALGCAGGCGCQGPCGHKGVGAIAIPSYQGPRVRPVGGEHDRRMMARAHNGMSGIAEYGRSIRQRQAALAGVPILPGAPEPMTGMGSELLDPYDDLEIAAGVKPPPPKPAGFPLGKVALAGLALAVAWPHLKRAVGR